MANLQYIGARYVPKFFLNPDDQSNDWKSGVLYEALTIVTYNNDSYTSKIPVPDTIGDPASNPQYWACTTKYTAALMALQTTVGNIEDQIGDATLNTASQTLSEAINEIFGSKKFESYRYGSINSTTLGQSALYHNNKFYIAGGTGLTSQFQISAYDNDLQLLGDYVFNIDCHPNAMFAIGNNIYVVDSRNHDLIVINSSDMSYVETITAFEPYLIASGCYYKNFIYLYGDNKVYKITPSMSVVETLALAVPAHVLPTVHQGIFIFNDIIYRVFNQPNMLVMYNMKGELLGTVDVGEGSGFYPYGELETFFIKNNEVYFSSRLWSVTPAGSPWVVEIFVSNINSPVLSDNRYGQRSPEREIIYAGTRTSKNPTGESTNPFDNLFEAGCVINYLSTLYPWYICLYLNENIFSNAEIVFNGCNVDITPTGRTIKTISAYNSNIHCQQITIGKLFVHYGEIKLNRCTIDEMELQNVYAFFGGSKVTTKYKGSNVISPDGKLNCTAPKTDVTTTGGFIKEVMSKISDGYSVAHQALNTFAEKFTFNYLSTARSDMIASFIFTGTGFSDISFEKHYPIRSGAKTSYNNGTILDFPTKEFITANGNSGWLEFILHLDPVTGVYADNITFTALDGTSLTAPNNVYPLDNLRFVHDATL